MLRTFAKMCSALGIEKGVFSVLHKKHITKVMAHATVVFCFTGDPENVGDCVLFNCSAVNNSRLSKRRIEVKEGGKAVQKGDCLLTDCNVTGTDTGTPDKPKLALRRFWEFGLGQLTHNVIVY